MIPRSRPEPVDPPELPTVTVTCFVLVPPQPVPFNVYVVVLVGFTTREPGEPTSPKPGSRVTDLTNGPVVPFVTPPQLSVTEAPAEIELGLATKEEITGLPAQPDWEFDCEGDGCVGWAC